MRTDLIFLIPEITLLLMACLVLIVDAFSKDPLHKMTYRMAQLSLVPVSYTHLTLPTKA